MSCSYLPICAMFALELIDDDISTRNRGSELRQSILFQLTISTSFVQRTGSHI